MVVIATLVACVAGIALGFAIAPGRAEVEQEEQPQPPRVGLRSGVARLPLPAGWEPLERRSSLPGLDEATAVRGVRADVALDIRAPEDASLLPADVVATSGDVPPPEPLRLGGRGAWGYELPASGPDRRLVALTVPTTGGVVTMACEARAEAIRLALGECAGALSGLQVEGARALAPAPESAARIALPDAIAKLNKERRSWRRALAGTRSPAGRAIAARRLAAAYDAAAGRLRPLAAGEARRLTAALVALARDHRRLAVASRHRNAAAARRAGRGIESGELRLGRLLRAVNVARPPSGAAG